MVWISDLQRKRCSKLFVCWLSSFSVKWQKTMDLWQSNHLWIVDWCFLELPTPKHHCYHQYLLQQYQYWNNTSTMIVVIVNTVRCFPFVLFYSFLLNISYTYVWNFSFLALCVIFSCIIPDGICPHRPRDVS